jgi:hypothetical protein
MTSKVFLNSAHQALRESYEANARGQYLLAWRKTLPARFNYLADAVLNATAVPLYAVSAGYGVGETFLTWGRKTSCLRESLKGIDNSLSRVFFGSVGAVVSPAAARAFEVDSAVEVVATGALVGIVGTGIYFAASKIRAPNFVLYNSQSGFVWGWH